MQPSLGSKRAGPAPKPPSWTLKLHCADVLAKAVDVMSEFVSEATFRATWDFLSCETVDITGVMLLELKLFARSAFQVLHSDGTSECVFSLKLSLLHAVLRNVHPDDVLFLTVPSDPGQALHFAFERPDSLAHRSEYTVRQTVILSDHPHLSMEQIETRFIVEILLPSEFFSEIMNDLRTVSPELRIVVCEREVLFCAANEQISTTVSISKAEVDIVLHRDRLGGPLARPDIGAPPQEASLPPAGEPRILMEKCFLLRYLAAISRCHKASSDLILQLGEKTPISLFFALRNFGTIRFFVAPVFSDDDDNEDTRSDDEGIGDGAQHATAGDQTFQERVLAGNLQTPNETRMTELRAADLSVSLPPAP